MRRQTRNGLAPSQARRAGSNRSRSNRRRRSDPVAASRNLFGLSAQAKARLIEKLSSVAAPPNRPVAVAKLGAARLDVSELEAYREIRMIEEAADYLGIAD